MTGGIFGVKLCSCLAKILKLSSSWFRSGLYPFLPVTHVVMVLVGLTTNVVLNHLTFNLEHSCSFPVRNSTVTTVDKQGLQYAADFHRFGRDGSGCLVAPEDALYASMAVWSCHNPVFFSERYGMVGRRV